MKSAKKIILITGGLILLAGLTFAGFVGISKYLDYQYSQLHEGCTSGQTNHTLTIKDNLITPSSIDASRCDTLTIENLDSSDRLMAFGVHDHHVTYDGISEKELTEGQSFTVVLLQTGDFKVHDHHDDNVKATFQVR